MKENRTVKFNKKIRIISTGSVCGKLEKEGPLGKYADITVDDGRFSKETWEKGESEMCRTALDIAMAKAKIKEKDVDILLAGDLINQCTSTSYGLEDFDVQYFGLYGACSTLVEGLIIASFMIDTGHIDTAAVVVSSHFCSAERQYRFPLGYGSFSSTTAQNTVTAAGAFILSSKSENGGVYIDNAEIGVVTNSGIKDASNMGAAMAPAAYNTLFSYLDENREDFDFITTGDLGLEGHTILSEKLLKDRADLSSVLTDFGLMIYDLKRQKVGKGGSGCGCSAYGTAGYLYSQMMLGNIKNALVVGTGAMMSPQSILQGGSIPAVAHLINLRKD